MTIGIVVFPGSNCDEDIRRALVDELGAEARFVWHKETTLPAVDAVVLPGGFSYGDYLRAGAIARFSPVMRAVRDFAGGGGYVLGICNGFQILTESGLLPGALMVNRSLRFICRDVYICAGESKAALSARLDAARAFRVPIAHQEGNYVAEPETLRRLNAEGQIAFRYCSSGGVLDEAANPNGSLENIAGVCSPNGRVLGMMPHPERCSSEALGATDGAEILRAWLATR
ncbi:MAG: phosphoribosylformylglycinamidine synthase subunit PurQ [Myxococcales bacterium]|nr:phosphoribosylformylglycinamidine synthase subunit PurQ [Myxococcales bacterium]